MLAGHEKVILLFAVFLKTGEGWLQLESIDKYLGFLPSLHCKVAPTRTTRFRCCNLVNRIENCSELVLTSYVSFCFHFYLQ